MARHHAGAKARRRGANDRFGAHFMRHPYGGLSDGVGGHIWRRHVIYPQKVRLLKEAIPGNRAIFGPFGNPRQGLHRFDRVFAAGGLGAQHDGIAAVQHGIGHIAGFGTSGGGRVHHALQHLGGGNHRHAHLQTATNNLLLVKGHVFGCRFHA